MPIETSYSPDNPNIGRGPVFHGQVSIKGQHPDGTTRYYRYKGAKNHVAAGSNKTITFEATPGDNGVEVIWDSEGVLNDEFWECFEVGDRTDAQAGDLPKDDDAIEATLSGYQANAIEFVVPRSRLWIGTAGGEWTISGAGGDPVSPENIKASHEGSCGAAVHWWYCICK